ncbi:MAG: UDP-N-acetylmuramate dehydrogenase [Clostridia bacterium]|nr:UDP-N-acetylmuramate dehydrogenase [Clostridia bacterium]
MEQLRNALLRLGVHTETEYPLSRHSSFRIGGNASLAIFPKTREEMLVSLQMLTEREIPFLTVGKASNVVFSDAGFSGAVLFTTAFRDCIVEENTICAAAGITLYSLAVAAEKASISGLEFAHGIPGTLGGAVMMNAGAYGGSMQDVCVKSEYFDTESGKIGEFIGTEQEYSYRKSIYSSRPNYVILGATLQGKADDPCAIRARMEDYKQRRRTTQPLEYPSAGSVFKRPQGYFAGKLIEDCGLKGCREGGAEVSEKHAGFIVNRGGATAEDVKRLVERIQRTVLEKTGVALETEIRFL